MPFVPTSWQDLPNTSTPITAAQLNRIEAGIVAAYVQGTGTLVNADIAAGAAIAYSKLALSNSIVTGDIVNGTIVDADISASAAISTSKISGLPTVTRGLYSSGPPGSPADGDYWIATDSLTVPTFVWNFRYASGATTLKWEFIGGADAYVTVATDETTTSTTFAALATAGPSFVISRQGDYDVGVQSQMYGTQGVDPAMGYDVGASPATRAKSNLASTPLAGSAAATEGTNSSAMYREAGIAAATTITAKYLSHDGGAFTTHFWNRVLRIRPVRVI